MSLLPDWKTACIIWGPVFEAFRVFLNLYYLYSEASGADLNNFLEFRDHPLGEDELWLGGYVVLEYHWWLKQRIQKKPGSLYGSFFDVDQATGTGSR